MTPWLSSSGLDIFLPTPGSARDWIYVDWKGWHNADSVREGCEAMLEALRRAGLSKILNDNTNGVGDWAEASDWVAHDWLPRMEAAGLLVFAWVHSPSHISRRAANRSVAETEAKQVIWLFDDRESAEAWLAARVW